MNYTFHIDESGKFEDEHEPFRIVAGVLLGDDGDLAAMTAQFDELARQQGLPGDPFHGCEWKGVPYEKRRQWRHGLLEAALHAGFRNPTAVAVIVPNTLPKFSPESLLHERVGANRYYRALLGLVVRTLGLAPPLAAGDRVAVHVSERRFTIRQPDAKKYRDLGFSVYTDKKSRKTYVSDMDKAGLVRLVTCAMGLSPLKERAVPDAFGYTQAERHHSHDDRYVLADCVSNLLLGPVLRNQSNLGRWVPEPDLLPKGWDLVLFDGGAAGDALVESAAAEQEGNLARAVVALNRTSQPAYQQRLMNDVVAKLQARFAQGDSGQRQAEVEIVQMVERLLFVNPYGNLTDIERLAGLVAERTQDFRLRARTQASLQSVYNHRGDIAEAEKSFSEVRQAYGDLDSLELHDLELLTEAEVRYGVTLMNSLDFEGAARWLGPVEKRWDALFSALESSAGASVHVNQIGRIAGTLAQIHAHLGQWPEADRYFDKASRHLPSDHQQSAYRAHSWIDRNKPAQAVEWAARNLGSRRGQEGWNIEEGHRVLRNAKQATVSDIEGKGGFRAFLLVKLAEREWIEGGQELARAASEAYLRTDWPGHPFPVLGVAIGRLCEKVSETDLARAVWWTVWTRNSRCPANGLRLFALQALAHLRKPELGDALKELCAGIPSLQPRFAPIAALEPPRLYEAYLEQFTFLYR